MKEAIGTSTTNLATDYADKLKKKTTVTITLGDGVELSLEEYLKMQREKELHTEAKEEFKYESKKFISALPKRVRKSYISKGKNGKIINPMEEKIMEKSESADIKVLEYCLKNPAQWIELTALKDRDQFKSFSRTTLSSATSRVRRFLVEKGFATSQGDQRNGFTVLCKITCREENFDDTLLSLYRDYRQWIKTSTTKKVVDKTVTSRPLVDGEVPGSEFIPEEATVELTEISNGLTTLLKDFLSNLVSQTNGRIDVNVSFDWTPKNKEV